MSRVGPGIVCVFRYIYSKVFYTVVKADEYLMKWTYYIHFIYSNA